MLYIHVCNIKFQFCHDLILIRNGDPRGTHPEDKLYSYVRNANNGTLLGTARQVIRDSVIARRLGKLDV